MSNTVALIIFSLYVALLILLVFTVWWRKKLTDWVIKERQWLRQEDEYLKQMRKYTVEQNQWADRRHHHSTPVITHAYNARAMEYNRRRDVLNAQIKKLCQFFPW